MYRDVITLCWSIKEVNKNLTDRKSTSDLSIKYLKNACRLLAGHLREMSKSDPREAIEVIDKKGGKKSFALAEVAEMLYDTRKIIELNLIDNIAAWAKAGLPD
jgi:hypothetical protein